MEKTGSDKLAKDRANDRTDAEGHKIHRPRCAAFDLVWIDLLDDGVRNHGRAGAKSEDKTTKRDWQNSRKEDDLKHHSHHRAHADEEYRFPAFQAVG